MNNMSYCRSQNDLIDCESSMYALRLEQDNIFRDHGLI
jgi:hypothetical protein